MSHEPALDELTGVSVILPVMNETVSLQQTVDIILRDAKNDIREFLIVVCDRTTPAALETVEQLRQKLGSLVVTHQQRLPFLGGALREAFELARGSHVILMASDLETDPRLVKTMIDEERKNPDGIVTTSRWIRGGVVSRVLAAQAAAELDFPALFLSAVPYRPHRYDVRVSNHADASRPGDSLGRASSPVSVRDHDQAAAAGSRSDGDSGHVEIAHRGRVAEHFGAQLRLLPHRSKTRFARKSSLLRTGIEN